MSVHLFLYLVLFFSSLIDLLVISTSLRSSFNLILNLLSLLFVRFTDGKTLADLKLLRSIKRVHLLMWLHHKTFGDRFYLWGLLLCIIIHIYHGIINAIPRVLFWWTRSVSALSYIQSPFLVCGCDSIYCILILRNKLGIDLSSILSLLIHLIILLLIILVVLICKKLIIMFLNLVLGLLNCLRYWKYYVSNICDSISIGASVSLWRLGSGGSRWVLWLCLCEINCLKVWSLCLSQHLRVLVFLIIYYRRTYIPIYSFSFLRACNYLLVFLLLNIILIGWLISIVISCFIRFNLIYIYLSRRSTLILTI